MARMPRLVVPGYPHHVTQRGVRSLGIFADDAEREVYLAHMREQGERFGLTFLAWCLMSDHTHLIVIPEEEESLAHGIGEAHKRFTRAKNFHEGVRGRLFQGRFYSCVLDEAHLLAGARYVDLNPVAAGLVDDRRTFLQDGIDELKAERLEKHLRTGRPCGTIGFVRMLEEETGRELVPRKRGWRKGRRRK